MTLRSQPSEGCASASFATSAPHSCGQYSDRPPAAQRETHSLHQANRHARGFSGLMMILRRFVSMSTSSVCLVRVT
jgi:hypothetical protein